MFTSFTEGCVPSTFMVGNPLFVNPEDGGGTLHRNARLRSITSERTVIFTAVFMTRNVFVSGTVGARLDLLAMYLRMP
jgi:hypothetical protein